MRLLQDIGNILMIGMAATAILDVWLVLIGRMGMDSEGLRLLPQIFQMTNAAIKARMMTEMIIPNRLRDSTRSGTSCRFAISAPFLAR